LNAGRGKRTDPNAPEVRPDERLMNDLRSIDEYPPIDYADADVEDYRHDDSK
jgi:hypothetical protein